MRYLTIIFLFFDYCCCAQVRRLYNGDTLNGNVKKVIEYSKSFDDSIASIYTCDTAAHTITGSFFSKEELKGRWIVSCDPVGNIIESDLYFGSNTPCYKVLNEQNAQGHVIKSQKTLFSHDYHIFSDWEGGCISEWPAYNYPLYDLTFYAYDHCGNLVSETTYSYERDKSDTMYEQKTFEYDNHGHLVKKEEKYWGRYYSGVQRRVYKYDEKGREMEIAFSDNATNTKLSDWYNGGVPVTKKTVNVYDTHDNLTETKEYYFSNYMDGPPHSGVKVGTTTVYKYDSLGNKKNYCTYRLYHEDDGTELRQLRICRPVEQNPEQIVRDEHGNVVKRIYKNNIELVRAIEYY